mgnify:FL=1|jgi:hypothetical protein
MAKTTLKSIAKHTKKNNLTYRFLAGDGDNVFYIEFTDELIICDVSPKEGRKFNVYVCLGQNEINLGPVTYVGKL